MTERAEAADRLASAIGLPRWRGWEFYEVVTRGGHCPREVARTWSLQDVLEAYYLLLMRDLRDPDPDGII